MFIDFFTVSISFMFEIKCRKFFVTVSVQNLRLTVLKLFSFSSLFHIFKLMIEIFILHSGLFPNFRTAHLFVALLKIKYSINYLLTYCSCLFQIAYFAIPLCSIFDVKSILLLFYIVISQF